MPYIESCEHDVFVSFAEEDNIPLPGEREGWVTELARTLETLLQQEGLVKARVSIAVRGNSSLEERHQSLGQAPVVVVILSPAYLQSSWLRDDALRATLLELAANRRSSLFVVCKADVSSAEPPELLPLRHQFFCEPRDGGAFTLRLSESANNQRYYDKATDLARNVAQQLAKLRSSVENPRVQSSAAPRERVFLAEVPPALEARRAEVERYLDQLGIGAVPRGRLPVDLAELRAAVTKELAGCRGFVQLLGADSVAAASDSSVRVQLAAAEASGTWIMQWRDPAFDLDSVTSSELLNLLRRPTVRAESLPDFSDAVQQAVRQPKPGAKKRFLPAVFVDALHDDLEHVEKIFARYVDVDWSWGEASGRIATIKKLFKDLDGVLIFWGRGESNPRQQRYIFFRQRWKDLGKCPERLRIFDGPPPAKPGFKGANALLIRSRDGAETEELRHFIRALTQDSH